MSEALDLYRLQQLDSQIDQITTRIEVIDKALSDDRSVRRAKKIFEKAQAEAKEIRITLRQVEDKVEAQRIKRKTTQTSLFSGKIKNPKELEDLQMESEALKRYITQLEDEQLEAMIAYESAEKAENQALKDLEQAKGTAIEENAEMLGERDKIQEDLERFLREKEAVLQSIPVENIRLYQKLRKLKRGAAVTTISDGGCSICGQALTPADQQSIRASNRLIFCPSCGRILFED